MTLAFALMAAINGSTGSCATLSHGLQLPHQASPASARRPLRFSPLRGGVASAARARRVGCQTWPDACAGAYAGLIGGGPSVPGVTLARSR